MKGPEPQPNERTEAGKGSRQAPGPVRQGAQPMLKCPFCSGKRFDFGRDVYAGPERLMYCRVTPKPGRQPAEGISLPMKGAVCLDCGYVAMMVDINQLHAPIRSPRDAASVLARHAGAAAHLARSPVEEAAEALERMKRGESGEGPRPPAPLQPEGPAPAGPRPQGPGPTGEDDFGDLDELLADAERKLGLERKVP